MSPAAAGAVALLVATLAVLVWSTTRRIPGVSLILWTALGLRLLAALVQRFLLPLPDSGKDALDFQATAWVWAQEGVSAAPGHFTWGSHLYPWTVSLQYALVGREPLVPQLVNVGLGTVVVLAVYLAANELWGARGAYTAGWLAAVWPSLILYSAILLREPFIVAGVAVGVCAGVRWWKRGSLWALAAALAAFGSAAAFHEGAAPILALVLAVALARLAMGGRSGMTRRAVAAGMAGATIALGASWTGGLLRVFGGIESFTIETITYRQSRFGGGGDSGYLHNLIAQSWFDLVWQTPIRIFYFLFSPMPWDVIRASYLGGVLDAGLYLFVAIVLVASWRSFRHKPAAWFIIAVIALLLVVFALNTYNAGTAIRHRAKIAPLLLILFPAYMFMPRPRLKHRRLLLVVNDPSSFFPARHHLAEAAKRGGFEVHVAGPPGRGQVAIDEAGWSYHVVRMDRRNLRPWAEWPALWGLLKVIRHVRPTTVHAFALKPIFHAGLASRILRVRSFVATVTGLGYLFIGDGLRVRVARRAVSGALRIALDHENGVVVFQNEDDRDLFTRLRITNGDRTRIVPGSGVDLDEFRPVPEPDDPVTFVLAGRMLRDKGIHEFVKAAREVRSRGLDARFVLVGDTDPGNPTAIPKAVLDAWLTEGVVEWWGHRADMPAVYRRAHVVVLPSYREGIPRTLLEGAATGRPLIATDVAGCRDVCRDGRNGILVPARDATELAEAMARLALDARLRAALGRAARQTVVGRFGRHAMEQAQLAVYAGLEGQTRGHAIAAGADPAPGAG